MSLRMLPHGTDMALVVEQRRAHHRALLSIATISIAVLGIALTSCVTVGDREATIRSASAHVAKTVRPTRPTPAVRALLLPLAAPECDVTGRADLDERQKLDYQGQCYRQAEILARDRLHRLQNVVRKMVHAN